APSHSATVPQCHAFCGCAPGGPRGPHLPGPPQGGPQGTCGHGRHAGQAPSLSTDVVSSAFLSRKRGQVLHFFLPSPVNICSPFLIPHFRENFFQRRGPSRPLLRLFPQGALMLAAVPPDPVELLQAARAGDRPALGRLLELYRNYLRLLARLQVGRRLRGKADPSDLVQEAFLAAQRTFAQFRGSSDRELVDWRRQIMPPQLAYPAT